MRQIRVVVLTHFVVGQHEAVEDGRLVHQQEPQPPFLGNLVGGRFLREEQRHVAVGRFHLVAEVGGAERDDVHADSLVAAPVLAGDLGVRHAHPAGDGLLQPVDQDFAADLLLELPGVQGGTLLLQQLAVARLADEPTVDLEGRQRQDALAHLRVAHFQAQPLRFGQRRVAVDHLLQNLPVDAERAEHFLGDLPARLQAVRLKLAGVYLLEVGQRDFLFADARDDVAGQPGPAGLVHEAGNVQEDECKNDEREAPLEPALVASHPVEHGHAGNSTTRLETSARRACDILLTQVVGSPGV